MAGEADENVYDKYSRQNEKISSKRCWFYSEISKSSERRPWKCSQMISNVAKIIRIFSTMDDKESGPNITAVKTR